MTAAKVSGRVEGIDVARGLAGIVMIQGHAYDGWASAEAKETFAYSVTRLLGTLPLPAFLILAGAAVAWRIDAAAQRGEDPHQLRLRIAWRGLTIVLWGYGVSVAYALIDGAAGIETVLRGDVLHLIGLSISIIALVGIRRQKQPGPNLRWLGTAALVVGVGVTIVCPWFTRLTVLTDGPARFVVGLVGDVPGVGLMPLVPLMAWFCVGVGAARWMLAARKRSNSNRPAGAPTRTLVAIALVGLAAAVIGWFLTGFTVNAVGGELSRSHIAVWWNAIDLAGRGLIVLAGGALLANVARGPVRIALLKLGRRSLVAYVFHIPFCYGVLGEPLRGSLSMAEATAATLGLISLSYAVVHIRDAFRPTSSGPKAVSS